MNYTRHISNVPINRYCIWNVWMHLHCWSRWMLVDASVVSNIFITLHMQRRSGD